MSECKIVNCKGYPELYIDGKSVLPIVYALSDFPGAKSNTVYAQRNIRNFGDAGINIVALDTDLRLGWRKGIPFDPEPLIAEISDAMEANPNAKFIIRLHVNAPYWWCKDNLDECVVYRTPEGAGPIVIGQAAEFDYAGTQACLALREGQLYPPESHPVHA